ncbi:hypothetical protein C8Q72DRAFT_882981 [Fomitopsis betulina]|nr:hypothetical protein C8Q72DRAFT_882981 [Fomitopsis betulina]
MSSIPSLNGSIGAALLGNLGAAILFGVTSVQAAVYFRHYSNDSAKWKYAVILLCLLDAAQLVLITVAIYSSLISYHVDPLSLSNWSLKCHVAVSGVSNAIIRGLFCRRLWNFSQKNWVLVIFIAAGATVALAGSIEFSIQSFALGGDVFHLSSISWLLYASLAAGIVSDVTIAVSLCFFLHDTCRALDPRLKTMSRQIILYGINTCLLTSLCEISCLVTYAVLPYNLTFLALFFFLPKLLLNALLATLNSRSTLRTMSMSTSTRSPTSTASPRASIIPSLRPNYLHNSSSDLFIRSPALTDVSQRSEKLPRVPSSSVRPLTFRTSTKPSFADVETGMYRSDITSPLANGAFHAL